MLSRCSLDNLVVRPVKRECSGGAGSTKRTIYIPDAACPKLATCGFSSSLSVHTPFLFCCCAPAMHAGLVQCLCTRLLRKPLSSEDGSLVSDFCCRHLD